MQKVNEVKDIQRRFNFSQGTWRAAMALLTIALLCACEPAGSAPGAADKASEPHALGIVGYNYTDRYIDQFYVNGQGGGNLDVSGQRGGGGGIVCCIGWRDGTPLPQKMRIKWVAGGCMKTLTDSDGYTFTAPLHTFKEQDVQLTGPVPKNPHYFEVHFYPDGHIEVAITEMDSDPRLKLSRAREKPTYADHCEEPKK